MVQQALLLAVMFLAAAQAATVFTLSTEFSNPAETTHTGSLAGGTMLFVDGTNLMTHDPSQVRILVGGRECVFDHFLMRENYIECDTPPPADINNIVDLPITVFFAGAPATVSPAANPKFSYTSAKTAVIYGVEPAQQSPLNTVAWFGAWKTEGDNSLYMEIKIANRHMEILPEYSTFQAWGSTFLATKLGDNVAGEGDIRFRLAASYGLATLHWIAKQYTLTGELYYFRTVAEVSKLSFHLGSEAGGLTLTLTGAGFPTDASRVTVSIEGSDCEVQTVAYDTVVCVNPGHVQEQTMEVRQEQEWVLTMPLEKSEENSAQSVVDKRVSIRWKVGDRIGTIGPLRINPSEAIHVLPSPIRFQYDCPSISLHSFIRLTITATSQVRLRGHFLYLYRYKEYRGRISLKPEQLILSGSLVAPFPEEGNTATLTVKFCVVEEGQYGFVAACGTRKRVMYWASEAFRVVLPTR